jgi:flagellar biosynthetic protein FliR
MSFTVERIELYILIFVRMASFIAVAPFFGLSNIPIKVKAGLSLFLTILVVQITTYVPLDYQGSIGYASLVVREAITGILIGYMANICSYIINFAGQIIDMEVGFSMVNVLDPVSKIETTITGNYYSYMVMLMMIVTNMYHFVIKAIFDSFKLIPIGEAVFSPNLYVVMSRFMGDYFIIGFRIVLPIFASLLMVNVVLGILAKIAPQMNMFVIGMQLKVFVGLFILFLIVSTIPTISDFIFEEMQSMTNLILKALTPA